MNIQTIGIIFSISIATAAIFSPSFVEWIRLRYQSKKDEIIRNDKIYTQRISLLRDSFNSLYASCGKALAYNVNDSDEKEFYSLLAISLQYVPSDKRIVFNTLRDLYPEVKDEPKIPDNFIKQLYKCVDISNSEISKLQQEQRQLARK